MNDGDHRDEIVRLEAQIDELAVRIENCRKFILAGQIAVVGGGVVLFATVVGVIQFDPSIMAVAVAAVLAGIVAAGSNRGTAIEATHELRTAEAKRMSLIGGSIFGLYPTATAYNKVRHIVKCRCRRACGTSTRWLAASRASWVGRLSVTSGHSGTDSHRGKTSRASTAHFAA